MLSNCGTGEDSSGSLGQEEDQTSQSKRKSIQFSCSVASDSLQPHGMQHDKFPCLSPTLRAYSNSCPLSQWCHSTVSSSVIPFSSNLQYFPASGSFQMNQLFTSGGQSIGVSSSASILPMNAQDWSLLDGLVGSPCSPRDSPESSPVRRECYSSIHVWACLFWKLNSVLRAQLERPADTCTQLQSRVQPQWLRPLHRRPRSWAAPALALSGAARHSPTAACRDPRACSDHPCPPALPSLLFRTLSSCPGSGDHLGQGLRALAREEYCPGTKGAERAGWHEAETKASACSSGMEDERKHLS